MSVRFTSVATWELIEETQAPWTWPQPRGPVGWQEWQRDRAMRDLQAIDHAAVLIQQEACPPRERRIAR